MLFRQTLSRRGTKIMDHRVRERTQERGEAAHFYLMMLFNVNMHTDFGTSRDCLQCWPGTTLSFTSVLRPNVPSIAEKAGDHLYPKTHGCEELGCWIVISMGQAATHTQVPDAEGLPSLLY